MSKAKSRDKIVGGKEEEDDATNNKAENGSPDQDRSTQYFANERTFLAWLRTSIAIIGFGFIVARFSLFLREFGLIMSQTTGSNNHVGGSGSPSYFFPSSILGLSMVGLGILLLVYALLNYKKAHHVIQSGRAYVPKHSIMYVSSLGLVAFGIIVLAYLLLVSV